MSHTESPISVLQITDAPELDEATIKFMPQQLLNQAASLLDWSDKGTGAAPQLQKPSAVAEAERLVGLKVAGKLPPALDMPLVPEWDEDLDGKLLVSPDAEKVNQTPTRPAPARPRLSSCPDIIASASSALQSEIWNESTSLVIEDDEPALSTQREPLATPITQTVASRPVTKKGFGRWGRVIGIAMVIQAGLFAGIKIGQSDSSASVAPAATAPVTVQVQAPPTEVAPAAVTPEKKEDDAQSETVEVIEASILEQASEAAKTDIDRAHSLLQSIPKDSAERKDPAFFALEDRWADAKIAEAKNMSHRGNQLSLLNRVINTLTVSPAKRQKALDMARNIEADRPKAEAASTAVAKKTKSEGKAEKPAESPKVAEPVAPKPVPSVIATPPKSDELVGNSAAARQKAVLYGAVLSGNASMGQMLQLKAACVQLQDMPCAGMAVRMIRRKKAAQSAK